MLIAAGEKHVLADPGPGKYPQKQDQTCRCFAEGAAKKNSGKILK